MVEWLDAALGAAVGAEIGGFGTYLVNRVQIEARLVRIETQLDGEPLSALADRVRALEEGLRGLGPIQTLLQRYGVQGIEIAFSRGPDR